MKPFTIEPITILFNEQTHTLDPATDLQLEAGNVPQLEERLARCAQQQAFLAGTVAAKRKEVKDGKLAQEAHLASLYEEARKLLPNIKNPTETAIRYCIYRHWDDTVDAQQKLIALEAELELLEGYLKAYEHVGFHIQSMLKDEQKGGGGQEVTETEVLWQQHNRRRLKIGK
jgi:hypothetical protein